jgi:hypothetical protein
LCGFVKPSREGLGRVFLREIACHNEGDGVPKKELMHPFSLRSIGNLSSLR